MMNPLIKIAYKHDTMRRLIAQMADGLEVHDLMEVHQMNKADAAEVNLIKAEWNHEQREKAEMARQVRSQATSEQPDEGSDECNVVEIGHKIPRHRGGPLRG